MDSQLDKSPRPLRALVRARDRDRSPVPDVQSSDVIIDLEVETSGHVNKAIHISAIRPFNPTSAQRGTERVSNLMADWAEEMFLEYGLSTNDLLQARQMQLVT